MRSVMKRWVTKSYVIRSHTMDAETYRRKAEQYLTFAHRMRESNGKAALLGIAAHWMQMAKQSECLEQQRQQVEAN